MRAPAWLVPQTLALRVQLTGPSKTVVSHVHLG